MATYIKYEPSRYQSFYVNNVVAEYMSKQELDIHYIMDFHVDESFDRVKRCLPYMTGWKCQKDRFCEGVHRYPKEDKVHCKLFKEGKCHKSASRCWYFHPLFDIPKLEIEENFQDFPLLVPGVGHILSFLRNKHHKPFNLDTKIIYKAK